MKKIILIFYLIASAALAQKNIEVKYAVFFSKSELEGSLAFNQKEMYFQLMNPDVTSQHKFDLNRVSNDKLIITEKSLERSLISEIYKKATNDYYTLNFPAESKEIRNVYDNVPDIAWEIIPDSKKEILGFVCQKAIALFRGSKVVAYFTSEIPTVFGPAKFGGLPGLILEINDVTPGYSNSYTAYEINFDSDNKLKEIKKTDATIDYQAFRKEADAKAQKRANAFLRKIRANSPRGFRTEKEGKQKRSGFEKKFEWEKK